MLSAVGTDASALDTPALIVDLDAMERNIAAMAGFFRRAGVAWRPHVKGLKVPAIAHRLIAAGASGITCAKVSEAEVMAAAGLLDILIANQVVGPTKLRRLVQLARTARIAVGADDADNVRAIGEAARDAGAMVGILIEVNIGLNRCGVEPGDATVALARAVHATPGVALRGVMGWEGHTQQLGPEDKPRAVAAAAASLVRAATACRDAGLPATVVSCGGSGTFRHSALQPGVTEMQAGGGVVGDVFYESAGAQTEIALGVLATVISRPAADRIVTDAGKKSMSGDTALPRPRGLPKPKRLRLAAEHGTIELEAAAVSPRVGDTLTFDVGYADTTVCLHDWLYGVRGGKVETAWPILGRGKLQ